MSLASVQITAIEAQLSSYFDASQPRDKFEDSDINEIARLLALSGNIARECPRIYIVLRTVGHLEQLDKLLSKGFADEWFPIREARGLPSFLDTRIVNSILQTQNLVETAALHFEHGEHLTLGGGPDHPDLFQIGNRLGSGQYGQVDKIVSRVSFKEYALKRIRRRAAFGNQSMLAITEFRSEKEIMKTFDHEHIVRYIGSYTDSRFLGLVMSPVADCDLTTYMHETCTDTSKRPTMKTFFGCLASALYYLHAETIKHRDIKPGNILIHGSKVLITDFGLSRDFLDTTSGPTAHTPRYAPPEVAAHGKRNYTGDIWSLGCVFLEIAAALHGHSDAWIRDYFKKHYTKSDHYHANLKATEQLLDEWEDAWDRVEKRPLSWIRCMLQAERTSRPSAARVLELTTSEVEPDFSATSFCGICCCSTDDHTDSVGSPVEDTHTGLIRQGEIADDTSESRPTSGRSGIMPTNNNAITSPEEVQHIKTKPETESQGAPPNARMQSMPEIAGPSSAISTSGRVFGVQLSTSQQYACTHINNSEENPSVNLQGKLPIVVAQCGAADSEQKLNQKEEIELHRSSVRNPDVDADISPSKVVAKQTGTENESQPAPQVTSAEPHAAIRRMFLAILDTLISSTFWRRVWDLVVASADWKLRRNIYEAWRMRISNDLRFVSFWRAVKQEYRGTDLERYWRWVVDMSEAAPFREWWAVRKTMLPFTGYSWLELLVFAVLLYCNVPRFITPLIIFLINLNNRPAWAQLYLCVVLGLYGWSLY
ncbi:kinase-like protein [Ophiobolus disseminans]|uniref:non-specific serine/threonine protein kinase n=1 Tax=Ophiobolus disseminans TaxID=1469910 RepID=A0A6A6ZMR3_9PLEO|nr:kinase-like protein [Ophiobolus disseminans]